MQILCNKGMFLETIVNNWCLFIEENNIGLVNKIPTNYKILETENKIITGVFSQNKNCDYIGLLNQNYIEFDAKETEKEYFSLSNIKDHQIRKLKNVDLLGGKSFILIYFHLYDSIYKLDINQIVNFKTKKIPYSWFKENGIKVDFSNLILNLHELV